jgi:hypothetical protein
LKGVAISDGTTENSSTIFLPFERYFANLMAILSEKDENEENLLMR